MCSEGCDELVISQRPRTASRQRTAGVTRSIARIRSTGDGDVIIKQRSIRQVVAGSTTVIGNGYGVSHLEVFVSKAGHLYQIFNHVEVWIANDTSILIQVIIAIIQRHRFGHTVHCRISVTVSGIVATFVQ